MSDENWIPVIDARVQNGWFYWVKDQQGRIWEGLKSVSGGFWFGSEQIQGVAYVDVVNGWPLTAAFLAGGVGVSSIYPGYPHRAYEQTPLIRCCDCRYWKGECGVADWRICEHPIVNTEPQPDGFGVITDDNVVGSGAFFASGPRFGCVHGERATLAEERAS